jgi:hypothetical protein
MKKACFYGLVIIIIGIMAFMACGSSPSEKNNSNAVLMWQSEVQDYLLSQHNQNNNLVYFFIDKNKQNENAYAFIITDQMSEDDMMKCLVDYSTTGDIPGFRTTKASANWYNNYSPVVIQNDYRGVSLAAFSLPNNIRKIWILSQNITINDNQANNKAFPLFPFEITEAPLQYYLINGNTGKSKSMDQTEMDKFLKKTTFYATQVGTKFQTGYIAGKGQNIVMVE